MRTALFMLALTPLLGGCLGPAPWADWDKGYAVSSSEPASTATWSDWDQGAAESRASTDDSFRPPADDVTYGPRPTIQTLAAEPITAPPPTLAQPIPAGSSMGGPYAPLDDDAEAGGAAAAQPLRLRGSETARTLPLVMTGTGEKVP